MAKANYWKASWPAMKNAVPSFLFPFFFVYAPGTLLQGDSIFTIIYRLTAVCLIFIAFVITFNSFWIVSLSNSEKGIFITSLCRPFQLHISNTEYSPTLGSNYIGGGRHRLEYAKGFEKPE